MQSFNLLSFILFIVLILAAFAGGAAWMRNALTKHPGKFEELRARFVDAQIDVQLGYTDAKQRLTELANELERKAKREADRIRSQIHNATGGT